jgi:hypothetical protein
MAALRIHAAAAHRPLDTRAMFVGAFVAASFAICALMI